MNSIATFPEWTVTFLFTDNEGSTRLWEEQPEVKQGALARHDELMRDVISQLGGVLINSTGDGMQGAFVSVLDVLQAALAAQRAMMDGPWNVAIGQLKIRIAIHTGIAQLCWVAHHHEGIG